MTMTASGDSTALDPERPWITDPENLPARMNWFQVFFNPMGRSPKLHFTRAWTALFFTQLILWFGVSGLILGISGLIGADVSGPRVIMTYVLAAVFIITTVLSFVIHARRFNHARRASLWAVIVLVPLFAALLQFVVAVQQNSAAYTKRYDARADYLADPVGWHDAQLDKRRAEQAKQAEKAADEAAEDETEQTVEQCLASRTEQDAAMDSDRPDEAAEGAAGAKRGRRGGRGDPGERGGWANDPISLANQPLPTQEAFILRPAAGGITSTIMLLSMPIAIWSLLFVARAPINGPQYLKRGVIGILFGRKGRIGRQQFWGGVVLNMLLCGAVFAIFATIRQVIPPVFALGPIIALGLFIYIQSLLTIKRLHDLGEPARRMLMPWIMSAGLLVIGSGVAMLQMQAIQAQIAGCGGPQPMAAYITGGAVGFTIVAMHIGFLMWLGLSGPNLHDETYGPAPSFSGDAY